MAKLIFCLLGAQGDRHVARTRIGVWGTYTLLGNHLDRGLQERLDRQFKSPKKGLRCGEAQIGVKSISSGYTLVLYIVLNDGR